MKNHLKQKRSCSFTHPLQSSHSGETMVPEVESRQLLHYSQCSVNRIIVGYDRPLDVRGHVHRAVALLLPSSMATIRKKGNHKLE